ncbi:PTS transporter subunit EIIC [Sphingomonas changnyeongensis]|uniref:PTS transporter subunit EIIC n=1 Tax=Sphingomonas changnyeongensis TaxID=2698679 RepID=A0A7Z2S8B4_9SPHN|nr:N-acetylglucosamine-specific PTS transporter subunit IIBC [Sphingomonas changnyeongensis]QHL91231.1 PTS transporter subunit EIIC [Sphingomonas changnyeongensis]
MSAVLARLQPLGRALMLPIAVLPVAGLLLRLGQPDLLDLTFIAAAGNAIFGHLGLLFGIGVAIGLARENHGAAGLAGAVAYLVATEGAKALLAVPPGLGAGLGSDVRAALTSAWRDGQIARLSVPAGIVSGLIAGQLYNRYADIRMPDYLAFFGGRRFVPIAAGLAGLGVALVFGMGFPLLSAGVDMLSRRAVEAGPAGLFAYGALNRLLIVTGLHHILNNIAWFILGDFGGATGDLKRFFAGDPAAGAFMSGFFPVMMFGLPAACLAMYRAAHASQRRAVGGMLLSLGATSFLTGVTEPIEFSFMFLAPALYALHAILTGLSMALMDALGVRLGFGFSAGLFDYLLSFGLATRPLMLLPVGAAYALVYYAAFSWCIRRFDLKTPGRDPADDVSATIDADSDADMALPVAARFAAALGGPGNLSAIDACTTRLRLRVADQALVDEAALRRLGARGVFRPGGDALQVVIGPTADRLAGEIRQIAAETAPAEMPDAPLDARTVPVPLPAGLRSAIDAHALAAWLRPLTTADITARDTRLVLECAGPVDDLLARPEAMAELHRLGIRGATMAGGSLHLIVGPGAGDLAARLAPMIRG